MHTPSKAAASGPATAHQPPKSNHLPAILVGLAALAVVVAAAVGSYPATPWAQNYDPVHNWMLSTLIAALPVVVLLGTLAFFHMEAHYAAILGLFSALAVAIGIFHMPLKVAAKTAIFGAVGQGLFPIGWIILNVIFMYQLTLKTGRFKVLQGSMTGITQDTRLQLLLIAFCFGAFFEGASGFGTPVAVTAALLIGLGFRPIAASGLSLIANTAPVAYGALGTPIIALAGVMGPPYTEFIMGAQAGRILPLFSLIVPFWLIWAYAGFKGMKEIWPAVLVAGVTFAIPQFLISNLHGPWLVDVGAAIISMICLIGFLKVWHPKTIWGLDGPVKAGEEVRSARADHGYSRAEVARAWLPWLILMVVVFCWGTYKGKKIMDVQIGKSNVPVLSSLTKLAGPGSTWTDLKFPVTGVDKKVQRVPPVVPKPTPEGAVFRWNWLSATGTGILIAAIIAGFVMGMGPGAIFVTWWQTLWKVRFSLITIAAMLSLGVLTRYSGLDATMGLTFAKTGHLYPFFGTLLGWLGVALTGSDTASNVLFGSLQKITAQQIGLSPVLMGAANSCGGVMGKMIDAQSIVVASTATEWYGHEGEILRYVFWHSIALACLVGVFVMLQAYVPPFSHLVLAPK